MWFSYLTNIVETKWKIEGNCPCEGILSVKEKGGKYED